MFYENPERLPYFEALKRLRGEIAHHVSRDSELGTIFPMNCCNVSTRVVAIELGLEQKGGYFVPRKAKHAWNYDPERCLYMCLTMRQYGLIYPEIAYIVPAASTELLAEDVELTKKQIMMHIPTANIILGITDQPSEC